MKATPVKAPPATVTPVQQAEVLFALQRALPDGFQVRHAGIGFPQLEFSVWDLRTNSAIVCQLSTNDVLRWTAPFDCDCGWAVDLSPLGAKEIPAHAAVIAYALRDIILHTVAEVGCA